MTFERINPPGAGGAAGLQPRGQHHAASAPSTWPVRPPSTRTAGSSGDDVVSQFEQALSNLLAALAAAGGTGTDLATVTIYIVDMDDYLAHAREIGAVWRRLVGTDYPAMAGIGVSRLWDVEALVEVQGIAVLE